MDYSTMFRMYDAATPDASTPTNLGVQQKGFNDLVADPALQTAAFQIAAALDPDGFGGRLAKAGLAMRQAGSLAKGMQNAQSGGQAPQTPQVQDGQQTTPQQNTSGGTMNFMDKATQLSKLSSMLKTAGQMNPNGVPDGYKQDFITALSADPAAGMQNPTMPVASNAGRTTGFEVPPAPALALDPSLAMSMTPEQIQGIYQHNIAKGTFDLARGEQARLNARTAWEIDPARVDEQIRMNTAPVLAQLDVYKGKQEFDIATATEFVSKNPQIAAIKLPGGMTVGQQILMDANSPGGAKNVSDLVKAGIDLERTRMSVNADIQAARIRAAQSGNEQAFYKDMQMLEKFNSDVAKMEKQIAEGIPIDKWNAMSEIERQNATVLGRMPVTKELIDARDRAKQMSDAIYGKISPSYKDYKVAEEKAKEAAKLKADKTKLEQLMEEEGKSKKRGVTRSFAPQKSILDLFNPSNAQGDFY